MSAESDDSYYRLSSDLHKRQSADQSQKRSWPLKLDSESSSSPTDTNSTASCNAEYEYWPKRQRTGEDTNTSTEAIEECCNNENCEERLEDSDRAEGDTGIEAQEDESNHVVETTQDHMLIFSTRTGASSCAGIFHDAATQMSYLAIPLISMQALPICLHRCQNQSRSQTQNIEYVQEGGLILEEEVIVEEAAAEDQMEEEEVVGEEEEIGDEEEIGEEEEYEEFSPTEDEEDNPEDNSLDASSNLNAEYPVSEHDDHLSESLDRSTESTESPEIEKCAICLRVIRYQDTGLLDSCEHVFCFKCIERWSTKSRTCPIDRKEYCRILLQSWRTV